MITAEQGPEKTEDKTLKNLKVRNKDQAKNGDRKGIGETAGPGAKHLIAEAQTYTGTIVVLSGVMRLENEYPRSKKQLKLNHLRKDPAIQCQ